MRPGTEPEKELEEREVYRLIQRASETSLANALHLIRYQLSSNEIRQRSKKDLGSLLHVAVNSVPDVVRRTGDAVALIPILYALALRGVIVNAQNSHGNTALHLASIRQEGERLCEHLIRIGVDPMIVNKKGCRVIHTYRNHHCVLIKGQISAKCGLWNAVEKEDVDLTMKLLKSWCRIRIRKNKTLRDICDETCNMKIDQLLNEYEYSNEVVCAAFSLDHEKVAEMLKTRAVKLDQADESKVPPSPLLVALSSFGQRATKTIQVLEKYGLTVPSWYEIELAKIASGIEETDLYNQLETGTLQSLQKALTLIKSNVINLDQYGQREETKGYTFLHIVIKLCSDEKDTEKRRLFIRMIYALARVGVDVNARNAAGDTALIIAGQKSDEELMTHCIRVGSDPSIAALDGSTVSEQTYEDRGALVFGRKYRIQDLPGLWAAVYQGDVNKAKRWLSSWCRVKVKKGDRNLIQVCETSGHKEIHKLLEKYEHVNEFVCATFACEVKAMKELLALGKGSFKVNTMDDYFHVGLTWDGHAEFLPRPIVVAALELCNSDVLVELVKFGADLSKDYAECSPCGPVAFWAFRDHVANENTMVVARNADLLLRDELGATLLHRYISSENLKIYLRWSYSVDSIFFRAISKKRRDKTLQDVVEVLLDRGIDMASRDLDGSTARDYIDIHRVEDSEELKTLMDARIMELVNNDEFHAIEQLLLDDYDRILQAKGGKKRIHTALELAELRNFKELVILLKDLPKYRAEIDLLHSCVEKGDLQMISKLAGEKRCAFGKDKAGRTLLHNAVLYEQPEIVEFLLEQFPSLINTLDSVKRTPLHYCVCLKNRHKIWPLLQDAGADPNAVDANNMSVYEYVRDQETPVPTKDRPRGRRWRDFRPGEKMIFEERDKCYGAKASAHSLAALLKPMIPAHSISEIRTITADLKQGFNHDNLDGELLKLCIENSRVEVARHFIKDCLCNPSTTISISNINEEGEEETSNIELIEYIKEYRDDDMLRLLEDEIGRIKKEQEKQEKNEKLETNDNQENNKENNKNSEENYENNIELKLEKQVSKEIKEEKENREIKEIENGEQKKQEE